jgi:AraC-like DNA-binding protein
MSAAAAFVPLSKTAASEPQLRRIATDDARAELRRRRAWLEDHARPILREYFRRADHWGAMPPEYRDGLRVLEEILLRLTLGAPHTKIRQERLADRLEMSRRTLQRRLNDLAAACLIGRQLWRTTNAYWVPGFGAPPAKHQPKHWSRCTAPRRDSTRHAAAPPEITLADSALNSHCATKPQEVENPLGGLERTDKQSTGSSSGLLRIAIEAGLAERIARPLVESHSPEVRDRMATYFNSQVVKRAITKNLAGYVRTLLRHPEWFPPPRDPAPPGETPASSPVSEYWQAPDFGPKTEEQKAAVSDWAEQVAREIAQRKPAPAAPGSEHRQGGLVIQPPPLSEADQLTRAELKAMMDAMKPQRAAPREAPPRPRDNYGRTRQQLLDLGLGESD